MEEKRYRIGEKIYVQRPMVLGQLRQLFGVLKGVSIAVPIDAINLIAVLGERLPRALAIVLSPEGVHPKDKDLEALALEIEYAIPLDQVVEVVEDFFGCNPLPLLLEKMGRVAGAIGTARMPEESIPSVSSSAEETSPEGTPSSGATPSTSADPGPSGVSETSSSGRP